MNTTTFQTKSRGRSKQLASDARPLAAVISINDELSKATANALRELAAMADRGDLTGYVIGGVHPDGKIATLQVVGSLKHNRPNAHFVASRLACELLYFEEE